MSLADALERVAEALPDLADEIRPANGDAQRLIERLDAARAREILAWLLEASPADAEALAAEWAEHDTGVAALAAVDENAVGKAGRKVLRRVRHRLRSRGVTLPEPPAAPRVARIPDVEEGVEGAFVSPIDPAGSRAAVIVEPHPAGGVRIFEVVTDELRGIRRCEVFQATRGQARRFLREATRAEVGAGVPAEPAAVRAYVARVAARQPRDRALPQPFAAWRSHVAGAPEGTRTPGEEAAAALGAPGPADRERVLAAIGEGRVGPWPPPEEALHETAGRIAEARESQIVVSGARQQERFQEILREAAEACYDAGFSEATAARFEESAYVYWKTGQEDLARACLAGAQAFRDEPPGDNPVARALLERLLSPLLAARKQEEEESSSLLVKP